MALPYPENQHLIIHDLAWEVGFEHGCVISTFVVTEAQIREEAIGASPLLAKVLAEGIKV